MCPTRLQLKHCSQFLGRCWPLATRHDVDKVETCSARRATCSHSNCTSVGPSVIAPACPWSSMLIRSRACVMAPSRVFILPVALSCQLTDSGIPARNWCSRICSLAGASNPGMACSRSFSKTCTSTTNASPGHIV